MFYKPGGFFYGEFTTSVFATGVATNADSLPVATANHNGTDDGTFALTVTNIDAGRYKVTGTVPSGYADGDHVCISAAATVSGVAGKTVVSEFQVTTVFVSEVAAAVMAVAIETGVSHLQALRAIAAVCAGERDISTGVYRAIGNNTVTRITYTFNVGGDRNVTTSL